MDVGDEAGSLHPLPDWRTFKGGTRRRVALWLISEVGEGGVFSKADLRSAFPGIEQIDRRMRDLRQDGWNIATYREDRSLSQDQLRLVNVGGRVWQKGYLSPSITAITDKQRGQTLAADGYICRTCGIAAGETYPEDSIRTAKLAVERYAGPSSEPLLRTVCDRCLSGGKTHSRLEDLLSDIANLDPQSSRRISEWVAAGYRRSSPADRIWGRFLSLPSELRALIVDELRHSDTP